MFLFTSIRTLDYYILVPENCTRRLKICQFMLLKLSSLTLSGSNFRTSCKCVNRTDPGQTWSGAWRREMIRLRNSCCSKISNVRDVLSSSSSSSEWYKNHSKPSVSWKQSSADIQISLKWPSNTSGLWTWMGTEGASTLAIFSTLLYRPVGLE